jgi:hypothetical protein
VTLLAEGVLLPLSGFDGGVLLIPQDGCRYPIALESPARNCGSWLRISATRSTPSSERPTIFIGLRGREARQEGNLQKWLENAVRNGVSGPVFDAPEPDREQLILKHVSRRETHIPYPQFAEG